MSTRSAILVIAVFLSASTAFPQNADAEHAKVGETAQSCYPGSLAQVVPGISSPESCLISPQAKQKQQEEKQTKRMMWVVPNFGAVSAGAQVRPLTTRGKFVLATHDSLDYSGFTWTAILAAQTYAANSDPELGTGAVGYLRYFWRTFADGVSGSYFTEAIVPSLTHEDPRYYTLGSGGFWRRMEYAVSRTVVTKTDSGGSAFNWSEVGGNALVAGLSNAYYPPQERGLHQTVRDWGGQMESAVLNNVAKEFWPDIRHKVLRQK